MDDLNTERPAEHRFSSFNPMKEDLSLPKYSYQRQATRQSKAGKEFVEDIRGNRHRHRKSHLHIKGLNKLGDRFDSEDSSSDSLNTDDSD